MNGVTKDNLFNLQSVRDGESESDSNANLRSILSAEKTEREAKTSRLRALRLAREQEPTERPRQLGPRRHVTK